MRSVAIVTDTSSDLLPADAAAVGVRLVPLSVSFGDQSFEAGTELSNEAFYERLTAPGAPFPRTAAPNPQQFEAAFRDALDAGADGIVCVTISQGMSATYASALQAARAFEPGRVEVIDSGTVTFSLAMIAMDAAAAARAGASLVEVVARVQDVIARSAVYFTVETLEYLQKGGRIGRASALLGTVLSIKPILFVEGGIVNTADKRRTSAKARARLLELVCAQPIERATILHTLTPGIEHFRDEFAAAAGLDPADIPVGLVGPVAGSHVGPGILGVSLITTA